jgi:hypothetical protein
MSFSKAGPDSANSAFAAIPDCDGTGARYSCAVTQSARVGAGALEKGYAND